jgi:succinate dehydrogenase hydrophobic anchor subunit
MLLQCSCCVVHHSTQEWLRAEVTGLFALLLLLLLLAVLAWVKLSPYDCVATAC